MNEEEKQEQEERVIPWKFILRAILYLLLFLLCLIDIKQFYPFALIFIVLVILNVWFAIRHWNDKPNPIRKKMKKRKQRKDKRVYEQERKQHYEAMLDEIEKEFDIDDEDNE